MPSDRRHRAGSNAGATRLERPPATSELTTPNEALFGAEAMAQDAEPTRTMDGTDAALARQATAQVSELTHDNPASHFLAGELAVVEARNLRSATTADAVEHRAAAVANARRELAAALAGNKFYERQITPLVAELDAMK